MQWWMLASLKSAGQDSRLEIQGRIDAEFKFKGQPAG